ncbi:MAG TPA: GFA family protein [Polyangiaceae bacterium]|jgi:hypothetical protein|nr:GFA family protein [Polyangiaceae bacterium]
MANHTQPATKNDHTQRYSGGCHCGAVRYEVTLDATRGSRCNCSICTKVAQLGAMVKPAAFRVVSGAGSISKYVWGGQISTRHFCKHCGVHCFGAGHLAELGGDFVSVNLNTLDDIDPSEVAVVNRDGRHDNWQAGPRSTPWPIKLSEPSAA